MIHRLFEVGFQFLDRFALKQYHLIIPPCAKSIPAGGVSGYEKSASHRFFIKKVAFLCDLRELERTKGAGERKMPPVHSLAVRDYSKPGQVGVLCP